MNLNGKVALVTGVLGRTGSEVARKYAQEGADLMLSARRAKEGEEFAEKLRKETGRTIHFVPADMGNRAQVTNAVEQTVARLGRIDILAVWSSFSILDYFMDSKEEDWDQMIDCNFKGLAYACHAALTHMIPQGSGRIISCASDAGKIGATKEVILSGTFGAQAAMSKALAREVARYSITVNVIGQGPTWENPTVVMDPSMRGGPAAYERSSGASAKGLETFLRHLIPFHRAADPKEVAGLAAFLATDDASFITGQFISVSGGLVMC